MTELPGVSGAVEGQAQHPGHGRAQHVRGSSVSLRPSTVNNAQDHAESMSRPEFPESNSTGSPPLKSSSRDPRPSHAPRATTFENHRKTTPMLANTANAGSSLNHYASEDEDEDEDGLDPGSPLREIPFAHMRIHFEDFARQLRLHRHHEHQKRMLYHQRDRLRNAVALSHRLLRVGSWVHDGLVQISQQSDPTGFTRVHHHMQDLVNLCRAQWHHEIHALDATPTSKTSVQDSFFAKLPAASREDCLELIHTLRSNPRFLVERFKAMNPEQVKGLSTSPKFRNLSESVLVSLSENRLRESQRRRPRSFFREYEDDAQLIRSKAYSKELEDYAASFERSNPLSFLIHNIYASSNDIGSCESQLRFSTWSTICASLFVESGPAFEAIIGDVLSAFAHMYGWQIKERLEMFLMGSLQRGAFLYNSVEPANDPRRTDIGIFDSLNTPQAQAFFDAEVKELFQILGSGEGGIPTGAICLGRAIVGKLPTLEAQSAFRGHFFFRWFLQDFLRIAMSFPEDESMLLQFHINSRARSHLLHKLWERAYARASDIISLMPTQRIDEDVRNSVNWNIDQISADNYSDPYKTTGSRKSILESTNPPFISVCAADLAHLLEKLRPQVIHTPGPFNSFLSSSQMAFNLQYSRATNKFDRLCRRILDSIEPGHSSKNVHPCQENWTVLLISGRGDLTAAGTDVPANDSASVEDMRDLNPAEYAALRLADEATPQRGRGRVNLTPGEKKSPHGLSERLTQEWKTSHIKTDSITSLYWHNALKYLHAHYPLTVLTGDDTKVLGPLAQKLAERQSQLVDECLQLEQTVAELEATYESTKTELSTASNWLNKLRIKLWYAMDVISSNAYDNARNIALALNNMAVPTLPGLAQDQDTSSEPMQSGASAASVSSIFEQPMHDTEAIMKAAVDYGGPRKLSDPQIEKTKKWLQHNHVENFCRGEERIHRFCMEVKGATRKLVGETIADSPVLWSSELFAREKILYDIHAGTTLFAGLPSTRAPSVMSEPLSSTSFPIRATFVGSRASIFGGSSRLGREGIGSDISSYISSPGRATTSTTLESSIWSPAQSNSRSVTSASLQSRPASTFESGGLNRPIDRSHEKTGFLESLRQDLSSLLLSDLACPVWSCGSESDAWMNTLSQTSSIMDRLHQRTMLARLSLSSTPASTPAAGTEISSSRSPQARKQRSQSAAPRRPSSGKEESFASLRKALVGSGEQQRGADFPYHSAFDDILCRIRDHTDPILKLKAIRDFKMLSQDFRQSQQKAPARSRPRQEVGHTLSEDGPRRRSLDPSVLSANLRRQRQQKDGQTTPVNDVESEESVAIQTLKELLLVLWPKTMFRDLQYVAVFVSSDKMDDAELGQSFLHVGLAALAWKDEVCRSMVDVADRIVARDSIKRNVSKGKNREPSVLKAMEYWIIGAREGNAIAQRELASLYLTHPDVPPIVSLPLALSAEIFRADMMWEGVGEAQRNSQALCLALHWMQEAAKNGDTVAQAKLKEREAGRSIR